VMLSESQFLQAHSSSQAGNRLEWKQGDLSKNFKSSFEVMKGTPKVKIATDEEKVLLAAIEWHRR
jgi:hypothetical protein